MISYVFLCSLVLVFGHVAFGTVVDYCSENNYATNGSWLQFTKEPNVAEYAIQGRFKGLHCCAKGYRSIEWYKDGRPYPWPGTLSQLIIYPESANQTIYAQSVNAADAGNYTCLLRNDSLVHMHTITLTVYEKFPDQPKITYVSNENIEAAVGQSIRLFCEAFVGNVNLPDAHSDASWKTATGNDTAVPSSPPGDARIRQQKVSREDNKTLGVYLFLDNIQKEDFRDYICKISKPGNSIQTKVHLSEKITIVHENPNPIPWKKIVISASIVILVVFTIFIVNYKYGLAIRLACKDRFGHLEETDGKSSDVLIVYSQQDAELALGVLLPTLESKFHYRCGSREFPSSVKHWCADLSESAKKSRRIVAVMSPACFNNSWESAHIYQGLKELQSLGSQLVCVSLKPMPTNQVQVKNSLGETLTLILRNIDVILWERTGDDRFWLSLRLTLPPKRFHAQAQQESINLSAQTGSFTGTGNTATRLNSSESQESLEILV